MKLNIHNIEFIKSSAERQGFIHNAIPKIGFAGRSNVGKSSTINALLGRKKLARVSVVPGKTALVNYFLIDEKLYFVDLPGYGYAKVSFDMKDRWSKLMEDFFATPGVCNSFILLVDARHKPTKDDCIMCDYFKQTGLPYIVGANKIDSVKKSELAGNLEVIRSTLGIGEEIGLYPYSAKSKGGVKELFSAILSGFELTL